jgi:hypothetical protein
MIDGELPCPFGGIEVVFGESSIRKFPPTRMRALVIGCPPAGGDPKLLK